MQTSAAIQSNCSRNVEVREFELKTGQEEIMGRVVDAQRQPLSGIRVSAYPIDQFGNNSNILGHRENSQLTTDDQGRFRLSNLPPGRYRITAHGPRNGADRIPTVSVDAETGDTNVTLFMVLTTPTPTPRLRVQSVTDF